MNPFGDVISAHPKGGQLEEQRAEIERAIDSAKPCPRLRRTDRTSARDAERLAQRVAGGQFRGRIVLVVHLARANQVRVREGQRLAIPTKP